ncbi:MAG: formate-dependent phosphoribosylglycinamide formyltransferase [Sphingomonadales bacterium]|nr:formate-dependent phosphoribosylglycinamide formyltransferase [Sphingomonadales bacterium]NCO47789.1 formate-dependent phosphoribosylglycinamide formyltransferase [Sphingomonadales bacterium]NCP01105.1 formate-dependent phosphoribosylglycinamide formyltransferase [Sphingomonadales bacterium]NCP27506.1 formate-dependent phosphoribosylglycinamide formyltransferase [Sphingomonadales bacterium]NCP43327.1 formate-dependent phosphoribosylglycinamide formyltransferase [Sphingomonadales bacterium]
MTFTKKILLLGSGELGREFTISAKRLGAYVIACDSYDHAPAMQVADSSETLSMLDAEKLRAVIQKHQPDLIVPEVEAIRTEILADMEAEGFHVVPSARATQLTMNRDAIRDVAAKELGLTTSRYHYAESFAEVASAAADIGLPLVIKPVMSSSGKGQSKVDSEDDLETAWDHAVANMRGDRARVIVEQFIDFDCEITLLTVRTRDGILFCPPIGHRQERGDYQESWQPAAMTDAALASAQDMARKVVDNLAGDGKGWGLFGVEFFVTKQGEVIFSELSPRPHDTGMVTLIGQNLSEFDLHARAIMGLPIPHIALTATASASAVILADRDSEKFAFTGVAEALALGSAGAEVDVRIFGKPVTRPYRRMAVALATGADADAARLLAKRAADAVGIEYE